MRAAAATSAISARSAARTAAAAPGSPIPVRARAIRTRPSIRTATSAATPAATTWAAAATTGPDRPPCRKRESARPAPRAGASLWTRLQITMTLVPTPTIVEIGHVLVHHADAARRDGLADRVGLVRAVDAVERGAEIERPRPERVLRAALHM